jgi:hypothetical protein
MKNSSEEEMGRTRADEGLQDQTSTTYVIVATRHSRQQLRHHNIGRPIRRRVGHAEKEAD